MSYEIRESEGARVLSLNGKWTIERAGQLKALLMDAMSGADHVALDLGKGAEVDLACLQLFCSAHRTSLKGEKRLSWHCDPHEGFSKMVRDAGYSRTLGCHKDPCKNCLWSGGSES